MPLFMPYRRVVLSVLVAALSLVGLLCRSVSASAATVSSETAATSSVGDQSGQQRAAVASATGTSGPVYGNRYWLASPTGAVWPLGGAAGYGSLAGYKLARPIVGINTTVDSRGYWMVA